MTAGVLWLLVGGLLLVVGLLLIAVNRLPEFEQRLRESGNNFTLDELLFFGVTSAAFGAAIVALGVAVLISGATWARILVILVAIPPAVTLVALVVFPLATIAASVLQFLPPVSRYVEARRSRTAAA